MRDFHKTHPSGTRTVTKTALSVARIKPSVTSEGTGVKAEVPDVAEEESSESEAESWGNDEDDSNNKQDSSGEDSDQENDSDDVKTQLDNENESDSKHETDECELGSKSDNEENEEDEDDEEEVKDEFVKTPSNNFDDKAKGDEDEEIDYTTSQLYDDVDIRLNEPVDTDKGFVQEEGTVAAMTNVQQRNENLDILQVIKDAYVTLSTVPQKTEVPITSSSHSSDLAFKFLNFSDIPYTDAKIVSSMDVHVHHEVPSQQTPTLLAVPVSVISDTSPVFSTTSHNHYHPSLLHHNNQHTHPPTTEATNPPSTLPDFASIFQFNNRVTPLEKEVVELKKDPLHTQVTTLVDDHLDTRLGATREEFMNFLSASLTARITKQMIKESLEDAILAKESSQSQSLYEAAAMLTEFELKKIFIDIIDKSESYLAAPEHRECYEGLKKSYELDTTIFSLYGKVYSLKRSRKDKDKDEDPSTGSDRGLKKRKTSKDAAPVTSPKAKESQSGSSKGDKSKSKSSGKSVQLEEPEFEVADSDMPHDQEENPGNDDEEPKEKVASKRDWFTKPTQPQEPIDPDWNVGKTSQQGPLKDGPAFKLVKGTRTNYAELEYDFEECYKALSEKLDWKNPEGGDYPFDLTKPLPLVKIRNR
ncbi:hypothetical protein Tco_0482111 [Tanacetum coccineum]